MPVPVAKVCQLTFYCQFQDIHPRTNGYALIANLVTATLDPSAHAEVVAIRRACRAVGDFRLTGCVLVSSCEPCPMCLATALWARVERVVYAADRDDAAAAGFDDRALYDLLTTPRERWDVPVTRHAHPDAGAPFAAWAVRADRTDY